MIYVYIVGDINNKGKINSNKYISIAKGAAGLYINK